MALLAGLLVLHPLPPTACGCDPLVEEVVIATDDFYYGTSVFTFWAQLGLGNFLLEHLPVRLH